MLPWCMYEDGEERAEGESCERALAEYCHTVRDREPCGYGCINSHFVVLYTRVCNLHECLCYLH